MAVAEAETARINYPELTEYQKENGLDPFGMQNGSIGGFTQFTDEVDPHRFVVHARQT